MRAGARERWSCGSPWLAIFPGLLISATIMSINFIGGGLRDALDPRRAQR